MEIFSYIKVIFIVGGCLSASGSPIAMVQHATSSQSFVIHQPTGSSSTSNLVGGSSSIGGSGHTLGGNQPRYEYKYEVSDGSTGDKKSHWETREGDRVRGVYTLYEPDGALRRVEYTADAVHGFNAIVTRNGQSKHFPPREPDFSRVSASIPSSYDVPGQSGFNPNQTSGSRIDHTRYPLPGLDKPGVGYSVNHAGLKRTGDISTPY